MPAASAAPLPTAQAVRDAVRDAVARQPVLDIHTHIYALPFKKLLLWGIDELLTYHYLIAEVMRTYPTIRGQKGTPELFYSLSKTEQADLIWDQLFVQRAPVSEACRGVLTCLQRLGLDASRTDLASLRTWFAAQSVERYVDKVFELSGVHTVIMTNVPFDPEEKPTWDAGYRVARDPRFLGVLRIDPIVRFWDRPKTGGAAQLAQWGYTTTPDLTPLSLDECQRFLNEWCDKVSAQYLACSLPPSFRYPVTQGEGSVTTTILERAILPVCRQRNIPFAMMIGSKLQVNPALGLAGDAVGCSDVASVEALCRAFPQNKFLVTMLARENQHELCVLARKFSNLHIFGCWWFLNNPVLIEEMTRLRLELLGLSVTPQHSDARVLDQLLYKWDHSRAIIGRVLADKFADVHATGWPVSAADIQRDVARLFGGSFQDFLKS